MGTISIWNIYFFLFFSFLWGHIWLYSGFTLVSALRDHFWWSSEEHVRNRIENELFTCMVGVLPAVLLLWPRKYNLNCK